MIMRPTLPIDTAPWRERGTALIMALAFLLLLTIIGISALGTSTLEEKMAGNTRDRNLAFQAAESALLLAESWLAANGSGLVVNTATYTQGLYKPNICPGAATVSTTPVWDCVTWTSTANLVVFPNTPTGGTLGAQVQGVSTQPKYIIEQFNPTPAPAGSPGGTPQTCTYRITARGTGGSNFSVAMLQSMYQLQCP